jgi:hypothetical protein
MEPTTAFKFDTQRCYVFASIITTSALSLIADATAATAFTLSTVAIILLHPGYGSL